ncbi:hypothetical protein CANARDRAFT_193766 [[Candida] arabinofermentans NRRL YB-2248]|uniref:Mitochondrial carrier protein RIM2 n=1 Tax=[Candida] arabinofermentans NRRL YB-2248 TaxID=983967 RepID=A0A1E4T8B1_9ASCO|nr:hypothetical protein CANARDRAFT_193766 [[Candida] arabinofermentans NRRL YB-2248]
MGSDSGKKVDFRAIEATLEHDINESLPYLTSDEKSSTLREATDIIVSANTSEKPEQQQHQQQQQQQIVKPWVHFVAGGLGGMCGAICTSPFDVVKTRLQSSVFRDAYKSKATNINAFNVIGIHFKETCSILKGVYTTEGPRALFKGLGPNLVGVIPARSINFFTYGYSKDVIKQSSIFKGNESSLVHLLAGISAGFVTSTVTNPIWLVKTRLQLDRATSKVYKNSLDCFIKIVKNEGFLSLYRGLSASYLGSVESTLQWVLYEQMKIIINKRSIASKASGTRTKFDEVSDWFARSGSAGFAKFIASLITYPHEVIRTRLRQAPMSNNGKPKYTGLVQCFRLVVKEEGLASMYGGLTPHLMRTVPNSMIMFGTWELFTKALSKW